jgi:hypothetical protein
MAVRRGASRPAADEGSPGGSKTFPSFFPSFSKHSAWNFQAFPDISFAVLGFQGVTGGQSSIFESPNFLAGKPDGFRRVIPFARRGAALTSSDRPNFSYSKYSGFGEVNSPKSGSAIAPRFHKPRTNSVWGNPSASSLGGVFVERDFR